MEIVELSLDLIDPLDPPMRRLDWEVIQDLEQSIKSYGLLQPILVRPNNDRYEVVFGNHRYYAARRIEGVTTIPAIVKDIPDSEALILALTENIQRAPMNPYDEGSAYKRILDEKIVILDEKIINMKTLSSTYLNKSIPYIIGRIRIFENLHHELVEKIGSDITITNALHLSKLSQDKQIDVFMEIEKRRKEVLPHIPSRTSKGVSSGDHKKSIYCVCPVCGKKHNRGI